MEVGGTKNVTMNIRGTIVTALRNLQRHVPRLSSRRSLCCAWLTCVVESPSFSFSLSLSLSPLSASGQSRFKFNSRWYTQAKAKSNTTRARFASWAGDICKNKLKFELGNLGRKCNHSLSGLSNGQSPHNRDESFLWFLDLVCFCNFTLQPFCNHNCSAFVTRIRFPVQKVPVFAADQFPTRNQTL